MKNILIISKSHLDRDPRVYKQILFLKETGRFRITSAGIVPSGIEDSFYRLPGSTSIPKDLRLLRGAVQLKLGQYEKYYWSEKWTGSIVERFSDTSERFELVIANDIPALPAARRIAQRHGAKLYLDAHEYQPLHFGNFLFNFFVSDYWHWICKKYLPTVDYMTTVCQGIANEYSKNFGVQCHVLMNLPFYVELEPTPPTDGKIRMIHHGHAARNRHQESMIRLMSHLDSLFELDFMLVGMDSRYGRYLKSIAARDQRIRFQPPVPMQDIPRLINSYDLGLYLLAPGSFNQRMALPNKIFEYTQGRLAIAIWPSQEMVRILDRYQNCVYSRDFEVRQMAQVLNRLTHDDIMRMKRNSHLAAQELNSGKTREQLLEIVSSLLS